MADAISVAKILQPGSISIPEGTTRAIVSQLQLLTPQYYNQFVEQFGPENWTWWLSTWAGIEEVDNRNFFWFENRGKLQIGIQLAADATGATAGATVTCTLGVEFHYNGGTQTPLREGESVLIASTNVEAQILAITSTTANAFQFTLRPKRSTDSLASDGETNLLLATDVLIFEGMADVGEASDSVTPQTYLTQRFDNDITEFHDTWGSTDLGGMTQVFIEGGASGSPISGAQTSGVSYFTYLGLSKASQRYVNNIERKLMFGNRVTNTGMLTDTSVGAQGFLPKIIQDGQTIGLTPGNLDFSYMHQLTRVMDVNGGVKQNMWMTDIFQTQDFSDGIFRELPAGAFVWGEGEKSEAAHLAYGFKSIDIDGYRFQVGKYRNLNTEAYVGLSPENDYFRNGGFIVPMGQVPDAKTPSRVYKNITIMGQQPPKGGSIGNGIRVWNHGGGSVNPTDGKMRELVEMVCYRSTRVVAANQFIFTPAV
jgi:hypothetical protein